MKDTMPLPIPCANCDPGTPPSQPSLDAARRRVRLKMTRQVRVRTGLLSGPSHTDGLQARSEGRTLIRWLGGLQGRRTAVRDAEGTSVLKETYGQKRDGLLR